MRIPYSGAGIGLVKDDCILMGKRADHPFFGKWAVPGGGREKGVDHDELSNAKREFLEETGVDFDTLETASICSWTLRLPLFRWTTFFFHVTELEASRLRPDEFSELQWVPISEIINSSQGKKKHFRPFTRTEVHSLVSFL